jgi:very-short-patch-repair endonuclease
VVTLPPLREFSVALGPPSVIGRMEIDLALVELARTQHHLIDRSDVARLMTSRQWCRRLDAGAWRELAPGVWCHRATPVDWRLQARAGLRSLGPAAALHGVTAAAWWGLAGLVPTEVEFLVPRSRKSRTFPFVVHTTRRFDREDLLVRDGLRLTSASRTIIDLAITGRSSKLIEDVIDDAVRLRLTAVPKLLARAEQLCGRGVPGSALLGAILLDSGGESFLERRFLRLVREAGLPRPLCQVVHRADQSRVARVDFQFRGTKVIVEVSGRLGHVSDRERRRDAHRRNQLQEQGFRVIEFTTTDVLDAREYVVTTLHRHLVQAAAR